MAKTDHLKPGCYTTQSPDGTHGGVAFVDDNGETRFYSLSADQMLQLAAGLRRTARAIKKGRVLPGIGGVYG